MKQGLICLLLLLAVQLCAQVPGGKSFRYKLGTAPFPHQKREAGYMYSKKTYPADMHYSDSSVFVYIPKNFQPKKATDIVVYFHGWRNAIDTALQQFRLVEQFENSGIQALFVFPEGPKFAPDSFGGKLEDKNGFQKFIQELFQKLYADKVISSTKPGRIILAGHSGAYEVIAYILFRGGMAEKISDVILFDALYGDTEKFLHWIEMGNKKLTMIYTAEGGTKSESENLMQIMQEWKIPFIYTENDDFSAQEITGKKHVIINSRLGHNDVIATKNQLQNFLNSIK